MAAATSHALSSVPVHPLVRPAPKPETPVVTVAPRERESLRPTRAEINLDALAHNLLQIRQAVGPRRVLLMMVKANAYGHGLIPVARAAIKSGAQALGVATADEALEIRESHGLEEIPVVVLAPTCPGDAERLQAADIGVSIGTRELLLEHLRVTLRRGRPANLHLNIDTGLGRDGFPHQDASVLLNEIAEFQACLEGVFTHFAAADSRSPEDIRFTHLQRARFDTIAGRLGELGLRPIFHSANSGAILNHPESHYDLVRPGILAYGATPSSKNPANLDLRPVLSLKSRLVSLRDYQHGETVSYGRTWMVPTPRRIGVIPVGYGDGYPVALSNKGCVLIRGKRAPIRGRICMDQIMIDLKNVPDAQAGDEVVLYGEQGDEKITLEEMAALAHTIPYELACSLTPRIPRRYVGQESGSAFPGP